MRFGVFGGQHERSWPDWGPNRVRAVSLDAFGTLIYSDPPGAVLRELLAERLGAEFAEQQTRAAIGAEIAYYRAHMHEGTDAERLGELHGRCAEVLRQALVQAPAHVDDAGAGVAAGAGVGTARDARARLLAASSADMTALLLDSLRFHAFPEVHEVLVRLRDAGLALVVTSNWDASLTAVLERLGLLELVDGAVSSAVAGFAKPDPRLLHDALALAGAEPGAALHVGDSFRDDVGVALRAGVRPVLIARDGRGGEVEYGDELPTIPELALITTLAELPSLLGA